MLTVFTVLLLPTAPLPVAAAEAARPVTEDEAWQIGWPALAGPTGNWLPLRTGARLVDDLLQARLVWQSEERDFGSAKTGSQTFRAAADILARLGPDARVHPGNWAGPIVAEGKVFGASFRPTGKFCEGQSPAGKNGPSEPVRFRLDAEDLLIALDARTGKLLWKAVEPGGLVLSGGKRGGFQVAPVYHRGTVYWMGSTGRLFAHEAAQGRKLWQADIGPAHQQTAKRRAEILAAAERGRWTDPDGPGWHTSLVVAEGVLVAPTFTAPRGGGRDTNLRGIDILTGEKLWEVEAAVSRWATPSVWRNGDRQFVLCATLDGKLRLIDPRDGRVLWTVAGLGANYFTLAPSATHVLVNVAGPPDPNEKRAPGYYGAYRIRPSGTELAWKMPAETRNQIPTWFDSCARQRYTIRDGLVYLATDGAKETPGRFLVLKEATGQVVAEHVNEGDQTDQIGGLFYLVEDRVLCRFDSAHGATHGGRHPFAQWSVEKGRLVRLGDNRGRSGLDLVDFTTAYEVYMETPIVAGRMFERTVDGGVACYDLRRPDGTATWSLELDNGLIGMPPLPLCLWTVGDDRVQGGKVLLPTDREAGLGYGQCRRFAQWERVATDDARLVADRLSGKLQVGFGSHTWPVEVSLRRAGGRVEGTWRREIAGLEKTVVTRGAVGGRGPSAERVFPTPWLADQPWTSFGPNPTGTTTWALQLPEAITLGKKPAGLTIVLEHDGRRFVRAGATAFGFSQAWHEVDARDLQLADGRLRGRLTLVLNGDWWTMPNPAGRCGVAGRIDLDAASRAGSLDGTFSAELGVPHTAEGAVTGTYSAMPPARKR
jgi:outer membrane protein assembly factor BamB